MTSTEKSQIRKLQNTLAKIDNQINVFFNVAEFERLGLVYSEKKWGLDATGNKVERGYVFRLTEKAKAYMSVMV